VQVQDTTPPDWITKPVNQVLEYGTALNYQIPVMDLSGVDHWTLNDTSHFSLSTTYYQGWGSTAQITSTGTLSLGNYGLNLTVYDNYDNGRFVTFTVIVQDTTPPTWITAPTNQVIELGSAFSYDLDATDTVGLQQWSINDTTRFAIDADGVITSLDPLPVATYGLRVQITDTSNNPLIGTFSVKVQDTTPPAWVILPSDQSLAYGQALEYQVEAYDLSGIAQWTISDTAHFAIDATGLITSVGLLQVDSYDLNVTATDPYGNAISRLFTVTVESPPPIDPMILLLGVVIAIILVVAVIVVIRRRK
ncbi:MAG: cadherin repeat domain-containing protein, partial [Promethearchaeota archaeon]